MEYKAINDLSTITTIPVSNLTELADKINCIICDCVEDQNNLGNKETVVDIGIGYITIYIADNEVIYKFVPCKKLEQGVKDTILEGKNPLTLLAENTLSKKLLTIYKQFI